MEQCSSSMKRSCLEEHLEGGGGDHESLCEIDPQKCKLTMAQLREKNLLPHTQEVQLNVPNGDV